MTSKQVGRARALYAVQRLRTWYQAQTADLPNVRHYGIEEARVYLSELREFTGVPDYRIVAIRTLLCESKGAGELLGVAPPELVDIEHRYHLERAKAAVRYLKAGGTDLFSAVSAIEQSICDNGDRFSDEIGMPWSQYQQIKRDFYADSVARELDEYRAGDFTGSLISEIEQARSAGVTFGQMRSSPAEVKRLLDAAEENDAKLEQDIAARETVRDLDVVNTVLNALHPDFSLLAAEEIGLPVHQLEGIYDGFLAEECRRLVAEILAEPNELATSRFLPVLAALRRMIHIEETGVSMEELDRILLAQDPWNAASV